MVVGWLPLPSTTTARAGQLVSFVISTGNVAAKLVIATKTARHLADARPNIAAARSTEHLDLAAVTTRSPRVELATDGTAMGSVAAAAGPSVLVLRP
uniref:Uncharacterized protein n=1 Tax=Oryza sativa subsp. japonica TaxID=39947 RepID=Q7F230_ORYSJ|nr:hypothetical protein [Oryza sativa Japonica Group]BAD31295.1 hypothetical protein [Oryza sativa Japonica Group]